MSGTYPLIPVFTRSSENISFTKNSADPGFLTTKVARRRHSNAKTKVQNLETFQTMDTFLMPQNNGLDNYLKGKNIAVWCKND